MNPRLTRTLAYALPVLCFAGLLYFLLRGLGEDPRTIPSPFIDKAAPAFSLTPLAGAPQPVGRPAQTSESPLPPDAVVTAASLRGRPWLLNVWASWCAPCLQEHPFLLELARSGKIRIVGMNYKDEPAQALQWLRRHGNPFDTIVTDPKGLTAIDYGVYGVPESFLIDAGGVIRHKIVGAITAESLRTEVLPRIAALEQAR